LPRTKAVVLSNDELGRVIGARSLGRAWVAAVRTILLEGHEASYEAQPILEFARLDLVVENPGDVDGIIERLGDPERIAWMRANFRDRTPVDELGGAASYATRLYDYESRGRDQVAWVTERLRADPSCRSAVITMLQPLSDAAYIPCVSLLHFWKPQESLELIVTAHSIDFGTKGYANLLELAQVQSCVAESLCLPAGRLLFRVTSAHVYERDLAAMRRLVTNEDSQSRERPLPS
jgi:thymidylate synthase